MARVQVGFDPRAEALQTTAAPNISTVRTREADLGSNPAFQLAAALGSPTVQQELGRLTEKVNEQDKQEARSVANSMTVEELGQKIQSGEILRSRSPLFAATLQHIYGENALSAFERDTISKMERGELTFNTQADLDKYLLEYRNKTLSGASKFVIAGFDKKFAPLKDTLSTANARLLDRKHSEQAIAEGSKNLGELYNENVNVSPEVRSATILERYKLLTKPGIGILQKDTNGKEALAGVLRMAAERGDKAFVETFLNSSLDNGLRVRDVLGENGVASLTSRADVQEHKIERDRLDVEARPFVEAARQGQLTGKTREEYEAWVKKNEKYITTEKYFSILNINDSAAEAARRQAERAQMIAAAEKSVFDAQVRVREAIDQTGPTGQLGLSYLPKQQIMTPTGEVKDFDAAGYATQYIQERIARENLPVDKQVRLWTVNGLKDPQWEKIVPQGISNLASVGWAYDGKNVGQLNPTGEQAIALYRQIKRENPQMAADLAGSKENEAMLTDIDFMMAKGGAGGTPIGLSEAAAKVNQARQSGIKAEDATPKDAAVRKAVEGIVYSYPGARAVNWFATFFSGNQDVNMENLSADIRRATRIMVQSSGIPVDRALEEVTKYYANPAVTAKVNNTLYYRKDLPAAPGENQSQEKWVERYINEVIVPRYGEGASDAGKVDLGRVGGMNPGTAIVNYNAAVVEAGINATRSDEAIRQSIGKRLRLQKEENGGFRVMDGPVPVRDKDGNFMVVTRDEMKQWIDGTFKSESEAAAGRRDNEMDYRNWYRAVIFQANKDNPNLPYGNNAALRYLSSRGAYDYLKSQGALDKPIPEMVEILKQKKVK